MISVIIPHYNMAKKCVRLINSIPDVKEIEVFVIDDYSTEDTECIRRCLKKRNNKSTFIEKTNEEKGAGAARNIGLQNAKGTWLLFADADDYFLDDMWENVKIYLESDYDIVYFPPTSRDDVTNEKLQRHKTYEAMVFSYREKHDVDNLLRIKYWWDSVCSKLIRRSLFADNDILFDNTICSNDVMGSIQTAYYAKKIGASDKTIYCITNRHLSSNNDFRHKETKFKVAISKYNFLRTRLDSDELRRLDLERTLEHIIIIHLKTTHKWRETMSLVRIFRDNKIRISKKTVLKDLLFL